MILDGRYRVDLDVVLGEGRSGTVFAGEDVDTGQLLAIKRLHRDLRGDRRLPPLRPATPAPGLVIVVAVVDSGSDLWVVSERFDGLALSTLAQPMAPPAVVALGLSLCDALDGLHGQRRIHGDLRPGNVLVGRTGAALFDLGLAEWVGTRVVGRPGQTAPELAEGALPQTSADLYGLGIVLYRALAAELPYSGPTPWAAVGAQRLLPPPRPPGPLGLARLVQQLLHPDPWRRPASADEVRRALLRLARNPHRRVAATSRWFTPIRPRRAWVVHGIDPSTGGPVLVASDLTQRRAKRLARHLHEEGWRIRASRVAMSGRDIVTILWVTAALGLVLPFFGVPLGAWVGWRWRAKDVHPDLPQALPPPTTPIPPRRIAWATEYAVAAGVLLVAAGVLLKLFPLFAIVPLVLAAWIGVSAMRAFPVSAQAKAWRGRIDLHLSLARRAIQDSELGLDEALALQGELQAAEREIRDGDLAGDRAIAVVEALHQRATAAESAVPDEQTRLERVRQAAAHLTPDRG
jgi:eukaryotic-like serine/threonine-protein kinase